MGGERTAVADGERAHFLAMGEIAPADGRSLPANRPGKIAPLPGKGLRAGWHTLSEAISRELAKESARGAALPFLTVLMAAGAVVYFALPWEPDASLLLALAAPLLAAVHAFQSRPFLLLICGALLAFVAGVVAGKVETWRTATPMLGSEVTTRVTGRIVQLEHQASGRVRLVIDVLGTARPQLRFPPERVRLTARNVPADLEPGDGVSGLARLMPPSGPVRPGSYDFSFASHFDRLGAIGFFMTGPQKAEVPELSSAAAMVARRLEAVRLALAERVRSQVEGPEGAVAVAMITGFRPGIPEEVNEWLRRAGLAHILSISGLHMALVAVTVMFMLRAGAALFPGFSSRVPVKKYAAAAALVFCTFYLFISGTDVAAQRSYIMLAVMLGALIFDRAALTMRNVAIAALIIIALSPHEVVGPSFQMSFAATAALVAGYAAWSERRHDRPSSTPTARSLTMRVGRMALGFMIGLAATSLIAGMATALYGIWHFQRATPLGLPANLVAMPLVSAIVMPAAVLAILAMPFGLDGFFLKMMGQAIAAVIEIARWFSERTPVDAVGLIPLPALLSFTAALVILVISTTRLRLLALPFLVVGTVFLMTRQLPDVLISEDARLIGIRGAGGVAVNRNRPNGFTIEDWKRALNVDTVIKPVPAGKAAKDQSQPVFTCSEGLCTARHPSGAEIVHAKNADAARKACATATLIVIDDATVDEICRSGTATVLTKRDLARKGSVAIHFRYGKTDPQMDVTFAIVEPWRPWHGYRAWSRASRGLPPNNRPKKAAGDSEQAT